MSATSDAFLRKAQESLTGAASEFSNGRQNNAANRMYYAAFQAAIAAIENVGIRPPGGKETWSHSFVQAQFAGLLVYRRKRYPSAVRDVLADLQRLRDQADYQRADVSQRQAARALGRTRSFVNAIEERESGEQA